MTRSLLLFVLVLVSTRSVYSQTKDFLNFVGGVVDGVFAGGSSRHNDYQSAPSRRVPPTRASYGRRGEHLSPSRASWTVVAINGLRVAAAPSGISVSHRASGDLLLTINTRSPVTSDTPHVPVEFVFNGQAVGVVQGTVQGSTIVVDDPKALPHLLHHLKIKNSFEVLVVNVRISGTLAGAGKAIEEVERDARVSSAESTSAQADAPEESTVAASGAAANNDGASQRALSEADKEALERTADGVANLTAQIEMLRKVMENQREILPQAQQDHKLTIEETIRVINSQIEEKKADLKQADIRLQGYLTSITPNNRNQYLSARKASEMYPKVPFYIPGTTETGDFWVEPYVTDKGEQRFRFHFIDRNSANDLKRDTIDMDREQLSLVQQGLFKLFEWSEKAQAEKIRRIFSKRAMCFPVVDCPVDGEKGELGKSSTEVRFQIYEDGATAGRIQRNKGRFEEGYNISIDSAMLLQAYAAFVLKESDFDFKAGTQSTEDLNKMFK